ncbi:hypothetical protein ABWL39_03540 [Chitinivorax sp. PXF-14]|uniref:leucine-rich repeat domain-containing protein n=1 Tax=Chitinivorax sp. PXF-14 TaxID=3230488 RepID=UPI0034671730
MQPFHVSNWPRPIVHPTDYDGGERLRLSWDLGAVSDSEKKQLIRLWSATLPELQQLRWLSIWSHVTQPLFEAACRIEGLTCLQIKWSNIKRLDAIAGLGALTYLHIGSSTKVESIEPPADLASLKVLELENFKLISDFSPIARLPRLESLAITGSMWGRQRVDSLEPLAGMTWLKSLAIATTHVESLRPLAALKTLAYLGLGGWLPMAEYAWLSAKLPNTECQWFRPFLDLAGSGYGRCTKCAQDSMVMLTGRGARTICRFCDAAKVAKHKAAFNDIRAMALAE